jgi:aminoglycoside phosphotransferase (APT) family kinase protein
LLNQFKWAFDEITTPKLVHWDLWEGNVFVGQSEGEWKIIGITDFERALWGDPLMEVLFFQSRSKDLFISHYDPTILKSKAAQVRRTFYNMYLAMIIFIETTVRSYPKFKQVALRMYGKAIYKTSKNTLKKLANQAKT